MHIKTLSKALIGAGVALIFVAIGMDTTVSNGYSTVHNLGLMSKQQNMLLLGGLAFLSGIVLFATAKIKQTPEEELSEKETVNAQMERINTGITDIKDDTTHRVKNWLSNLDNMRWRVIIFLVITTPFMIWGVISYLVSILISLYVFSPSPAVRPIKHLLILNASIFGLILIGLCLLGVGHTYPDGHAFTIFLLTISVLLLFYL